MTPRKAKPKQGMSGAEAAASAEQKLKRTKKKGKYTFPGLAARQARKDNA